MQFKGRKYTRNILKKVDTICRENKLSYTLLFTTLLSQYEEQKEANWLSDITIGMLYADYLKLVTILEKGVDPDLYVLNKEKDPSFNALYSYICMRSMVKLPEDRSKDHMYYDYFICVYPIFYAGNTWKEYRSNYKKNKFFLQCIEATAPAPYLRGVKANICAIAKRKWCTMSAKKEKEIKLFYGRLAEESKTPTKYALIPVQDKQTGVMNLTKTYQNVENCEFSGIQVMCIKESQEWLRQCYTDNKRKKITGQKANRAVIEGPETIRRVQMVALEILCEFDRVCKAHNIKYILAAGTLLGAVRHQGFIPWDDDIDVFMLNEEWLKFEKVAETELDQERFFLRTQRTDQDDNLVFGQIKRNGTVYVKDGRSAFNTHKGIAIDILPFYNSPDSRIMFEIQNALCSFFKTMTWAHMGSGSERNWLKRKYYECIAKVSHKKSYQLYYKWANMVKDRKDFLAYLCVRRNPYHRGFNQRKYFENLCEIEFEGHRFPVPQEYDEFLRFLYGDDYGKLPKPQNRINHHLPADIELNGLYEYEE